MAEGRGACGPGVQIRGCFCRTIGLCLEIQLRLRIRQKCFCAFVLYRYWYVRAKKQVEKCLLERDWPFEWPKLDNDLNGHQ